MGGKGNMLLYNLDRLQEFSAILAHENKKLANIGCTGLFCWQVLDFSGSYGSFWAFSSLICFGLGPTKSSLFAELKAVSQTLRAGLNNPTWTNRNGVNNTS